MSWLSRLQRFPLRTLMAGSASVGTLGFAYYNSKYSVFSQSEEFMPLQEMQDMVEDGRIVVSYKGGVFDVTDFTGHPGGVGRLQMVSGLDLEPFWQVYTQHNRGHVTSCVLDRYRIGTLSPEDALKQRESAPNFEDHHPYHTDPPVKPELLTNTRYPYNAETRLRDLTDSWLTPTHRHFVRNHSSVPDLDPEEYELTVTGAGLETTTFTLEELKTKFEKVEVASVIQCNGNRREDYHFLKDGEPAFGPPHWVAGAIACSTWAGVRLRDVFKAAGMDVDAISLNKKPHPKGSTYIGLTGYDHDEVGNQYCCSIPFEKGISPFGDVILAYEMNGEPIPRAHGYPVRSIVPGHAGARNCKYLQTIEVTDNPCANECNWKQYAVHSSEIGLDMLQDFCKNKKCLMRDPPVQEMPVQSLITSPAAGDRLKVRGGVNNPHILVKGLAWGGGGQGINRVDVSLDNGEHFSRAEMLAPEIKQRRGSQWGWIFFEKELPLPTDEQRKLRNGEPVNLVLTSKALNTSWNVQPEFAMTNRNPHGCCVNHWYRVPVTVDARLTEDQAAPDGDFANKPSGGHFTTPFRNLSKPCPCPSYGCPPGCCPKRC